MDIQRFHEFYERIDIHVADTAVETIYAAFDILGVWPLSGTPMENTNELRKFVIPFWNAGYIAFYRYFKTSDACIILRVFHQKEQYTADYLKNL